MNGEGKEEENMIGPLSCCFGPSIPIFINVVPKVDLSPHFGPFKYTGMALIDVHLPESTKKRIMDPVLDNDRGFDYFIIIKLNGSTSSTYPNENLG